MLDAYVIEEIKRREREKTREERPALELPIPRAPARPEQSPPKDRDRDGGVVIIDYS
jgi:hypothetical protein